MSEPFLGEVRMFGFNFPPRGWAFCEGQLLPISQNQSLYSLLGTTYGGDGRTTFALPDLRGRVPMHAGVATPLGTAAGAETATLTEAEMPAHGHTMASANQATLTTPVGNVLSNAARRGPAVFAERINPTVMPGMATVGEGQEHINVQPLLAVSFAIALQGLFPSRN